jgi:iron complex transport system substrate-binding protein
MRWKIAVPFFVLLVFGGAWAVRHLWLDGPGLPPKPERSERALEQSCACTRLVTMAPSLTETVFALGLGERVVGVTRFCKHPAEAVGKAKVGGFFDPDYEAVAKLAPDLVLLLPDHAEHRVNLEELGLTTLTIPQRTVPEILESVRTIGHVCGVAAEGERLADSLTQRVEAVERRTAGIPQPGVLVTVGRNMGTGRIEDVFVAGRGTFYDELLRSAGGMNVYDGRLLLYPTLTTEGVLRVNPQVVVELAPDLAERNITVEEALGDWQGMEGLNALADGRIHVVIEDFATVPGPRFVDFLELLARLVHPELEWDEL